MSKIDLRPVTCGRWPRESSLFAAFLVAIYGRTVCDSGSSGAKLLLRLQEVTSGLGEGGRICDTWLRGLRKRPTPRANVRRGTRTTFISGRPWQTTEGRWCATAEFTGAVGAGSSR